MIDNKEYISNDRKNKALKLLCRIIVFLGVILGVLTKSILFPALFICLSCLVEDIFVYNTEE